jgi:hypothetical protein
MRGGHCSALRVFLPLFLLKKLQGCLLDGMELRWVACDLKKKNCQSFTTANQERKERLSPPSHRITLGR